MDSFFYSFPFAEATTESAGMTREDGTTENIVSLLGRLSSRIADHDKKLDEVIDIIKKIAHSVDQIKTAMLENNQEKCDPHIHQIHCNIPSSKLVEDSGIVQNGSSTIPTMFSEHVGGLLKVLSKIKCHRNATEAFVSHFKQAVRTYERKLLLSECGNTQAPSTNASLEEVLALMRSLIDFFQHFSRPGFLRQLLKFSDFEKRLNFFHKLISRSLCNDSANTDENTPTDCDEDKHYSCKTITRRDIAAAARDTLEGEALALSIDADAAHVESELEFFRPHIHVQSSQARDLGGVDGPHHIIALPSVRLFWQQRVTPKDKISPDKLLVQLGEHLNASAKQSPPFLRLKDALLFPTSPSPSLCSNADISTVMLNGPGKDDSVATGTKVEAEAEVSLVERGATASSTPCNAPRLRRGDHVSAFDVQRACRRLQSDTPLLPALCVALTGGENRRGVHAHPLPSSIPPLCPRRLSPFWQSFNELRGGDEEESEEVGVGERVLVGVSTSTSAPLHGVISPSGKELTAAAPAILAPLSHRGTVVAWGGGDVEQRVCRALSTRGQWTSISGPHYAGTHSTLGGRNLAHTHTHMHRN